jgi:hypothetical protein
VSAVPASALPALELPPGLPVSLPGVASVSINILPSVFSALKRFPDPFLAVLPAVPEVTLVAPPVLEVAPPVLEVAPPVLEVAPPVLEVAPPVLEAAAPVLEAAAPVLEAAVPVLEVAVPVLAVPVLEVALPVLVVAPRVAAWLILAVPDRVGLSADVVLLNAADELEGELVPIVVPEGLVCVLLVFEVPLALRWPVTLEAAPVDFCVDAAVGALSDHDAFHCQVKGPETDSVIDDPSAVFPWRVPMKCTTAPSWSAPLNSTLVLL